MTKNHLEVLKVWFQDDKYLSLSKGPIYWLIQSLYRVYHNLLPMQQDNVWLLIDKWRQSWIIILNFYVYVRKWQVIQFSI